MATRDVQLIIKAKDEASRALQSVADLIGALDIKQQGTAASGKALAGTIVETIAAMTQMERVTGLVTAASDRAEQSITKQRAAIAATAAELAAVERQMASAQQAIAAAQTRVVDARLAGGNGEAEVAALKAAQQAAGDLETQHARLTRTLAGQQAALARDEAGFQQIASAANTAEAALASFGDAAARESLKAAAASEKAGQAAREQAAAQQEASRAAQAGSFFDTEPMVRSAEAGKTALADLLREEERQDAALLRLQDRIDPLSAIERKLAADSELLAKAHRDGALGATEYARQLDLLQGEAEAARQALARMGRGERGQISLFGLKPYELTNLGFQVNDVVTGLASGQHIMQIIAQQGGQILQLVPNLGARIIAAFKNPYILAAAVSLGAVAAAIKEASDSADRLRTIQALLQGIGESAGSTAEQLSATAEQLERIGLTSEQSLGLVRTFVTQGLDTSQLESFAKAAVDLSEVTGMKVPEALDAQREAFTRGYKAIADLDDKIGFLTVAEREQIRAMFDSQDAADARAKALALYERRMDEQASKARGPWKSAIDALGLSWDRLTESLAAAPAAVIATGVLDDLATALTVATAKTEELTLAQAKYALENLRGRTNAQGRDVLGRDFSGQIADLETRIADLTFGKTLGRDLVDEESAAQKKRDADAQRELDLENARTAAQRIRLEGEKAYNEAVDAGYSKTIANEKKLAAEQKAREDERKKAEQERQRREAQFSQDIANNGRAGLLGTAHQFVGRNENRPADRSVLSDFFAAANVHIDPKITAWCAAFVNAVLATNGLPTAKDVAGNSTLRARDFLTFGSDVTKPEPGDIVILKRGGAGGHVGFFQGFTDNGDVRVLGGNQANGVNTSTFKASDVLGFRRAPSLADAAKQDLARDQAQDALNRKIDDENAKRQITIESLREQQGLSGAALIDAQREEAIEQALAAAREEARRKGEADLDVSKERLEAIRQSVGAEFDLQHARERASAAIDDASAVRESLTGKLSLAEQNHDTAAIGETLRQLQQVDDALRQAISDTIAFYKTLGDNPQVTASIQNLQNQLAQLDRDALDRQRQLVEKPVSDLQTQRNALLEQVQTFRDLGQTAVADQLLDQLHQTDAALLKAIDTAIAFWKAQTGPEAEAAILNFQNLRNQVVAAENEFVITAKQVQDAFAGSLSDAFETFAQKLVETKDPLQALGVAALQFAADFTKKLAEMGLQMLAFKLATKLGFGGVANGLNNALGLGNTAALTAAAASLSAAGATVTAGGTTVTAGATALGTSAAALAAAAQLLLAANAAGGAGVFHGGGIAGQATMSRTVHPAWFSAAFRYHSGGVAGLRPDEVPAILQRGEEVITRSDTRHRLNGGLGGGGNGAGSSRSLTQVLAFNEKDIAEAMRSASGEDVFLTHVKRNRETVRAILND